MLNPSVKPKEDLEEGPILPYTLETIKQLPARPGRCSVGTPTPIIANSFVVNFDNLETMIYYYDFKAEPETKGIQARTLFNVWKEMYFDMMSIAGPCFFDGKRSMLTSVPLIFDPPTSFEQVYQILFPIVHRTGNKKSKVEKQFTLTIKHLAALKLKDLQNYLEGIVSTEHSIFSYTSAVDIVFRQVACSFLSPQGRVLFDKRQQKSTLNGMVVVPGYTQAIRTAESRLLLILDSTTALFYEEQALIQFLEHGLNKKTITSLTPFEINMMERAFKGLRMYANYSSSSSNSNADLSDPSSLPLYFHVHSFTRDPCSQVYLTTNTNEKISLVNYFLSEYQLNLMYPQLPCAVYVSSSGQFDYVPLECCVFCPQQKVTKPFGSIDIKQYKPSALKPSERASQVASAIQMLYQPLPPALSIFSLSPTFDMLHIQARTLPAPTLHFHASSKQPSLVPTLGYWPMEHHRVIEPVTLTHWAVLPLVTCPLDWITKFVHRWTSSMLDLGIQVKQRHPTILNPADPKSNLEAALQHAYVQAGKETVHPDLLVIILPDRSYHLYTAIKRICDTILGVASQCITLPILKTARQNHLENLCLKLNVKLPGGTNVSIQPNELSTMMNVPTIFMGADVTHPAQNADSPSIASVVASMNMHATKYISVSRIQPLRAEIILDMGSMVLELLQQFYSATGTKPQRILFYRDGISEGQFSEVLRSEVIAIRKACRALDPEYAPKLTFMVVQKRHHTRFYPGPNAEVDPKSGNLLPGLVVDSVITHPFEFDFYIQSHLGKQGLVKPTRYAVLVDENKFDANDLMQLSYRLSYLYPRGARSVSMVPPAFFAHVCAARAKAHVISGEKDGHRYFALAMVKPELEKAMYFM